MYLSSSDYTVQTLKFVSSKVWTIIKTLDEIWFFQWMDAISDHFRLYKFISDYFYSRLFLFQTISDYFWLFQTISDYVRPFRTILENFWPNWRNQGTFRRLLWRFLIISCLWVFWSLFAPEHLEGFVLETLTLPCGVG